MLVSWGCRAVEEVNEIFRDVRGEKLDLRRGILAVQVKMTVTSAFGERSVSVL